MGKGQNLWREAKQIIPGGNMLLSKRSEMFLPEIWPSYFSQSKGCRVWDLDGNEFIDFSIMGIGTNVLGYGNQEVDAAVKSVINKGNMSTLNCPEEVYLAQRLIDINPWSDMVKFARTGGEANAIAIRISRAASGKDNIAICGYHGWHDWYLSANLQDGRGLDQHLLPGLSTSGVPKGLKNTVYPFEFNDIQALKEIISNHNIGVIKMEVTRNIPPKGNFLQQVRDLADDNGVVLIFDECTSGFRQTFGGIHQVYGVSPDLAIYGKALGNGYAITAVVGRKSVMEYAQSSFISSTFWTERIGPSAGLATLKVMESTRSWKYITDIGGKIKDGWKEIAYRHKLDISINGINAIPSFVLNIPDFLIYKTFITQFMLEKGYLAGNIFFCSTAHNESEIKNYLDILDEAFEIISITSESERNPGELLKAPVCHSGFKRLN